MMCTEKNPRTLPPNMNGLVMPVAKVISNQRVVKIYHCMVVNGQLGLNR